MTATIKDAIRLLENITGDCTATGEHAWRKCPRCLAINLIQDHDPKATKLLQAAIEELKKK